MLNKRRIIKRSVVYGAIFLVLFFLCQVMFTPGQEKQYVELIVQNPMTDQYQLFWAADAQTSFTEEQSVKQQVHGEEKIQTIRFLGDYFQNELLRLDLGTRSQQKIHIESISFLNADKKQSYSAAELEKAIAQQDIITNDVQIVSISEKEIVLLTTGEDPFLLFQQVQFEPFTVQKAIVLPLLIASFLTALIFRYVFLTDIYVFFKDLWHNKRLILSLAHNDFKTKYAGSYFGILWAFVQPVCTILVFWFVFEIGFRSAAVSDVPFALWLSCGLVPWFFFSDAWNGATNAFTEYSYLVKKVVFKISVLPVVKILSALFVHLFFIVFLIGMFVLYGIYPTALAFQLVYYAFCLCALVIGLSFITSSIIVFFKDLGQLISIFLQFGMWLTPIMWSVDIMPEKYLPFLKMNPMYYIIDGYRNSLIYQIPFYADVKLTIYFWTVTVALFVIGIVLFRKLRPHFADVL